MSGEGLGLAVQARTLAKAAIGLRMHRQITIACGLDSLTDGAGSPASSYRQYLKPLLTAKFGDPVTPGWIAADNGPITSALGAGQFGKSNLSYVSDLAWTNPIRQKSFYGYGLSHAAADAAGGWGAYSSETVLPGIQAATIATRLIVLLRSSDASFQWRSGNQEGSGTATTVSVAGGYPINTVLVLTRPYSTALGTTPAVQIDQVAGDVTFLAFEFVTPLPGAKLLNLGRGGQKASEWAQMDDATARTIARIVQPDLVIVNGGMNDRATDSAYTFGRNLETIVDRWQAAASANLLLVRPNDSSDTATTNLASYTPVIAAIAASRRCGYIDDRAALGGYAAANAAGLMYDGIHRNAAGNQKCAAAYMARIEDFTSGAAYLA